MKLFLQCMFSTQVQPLLLVCMALCAVRGLCQLSMHPPPILIQQRKKEQLKALNCSFRQNLRYNYALFIFTYTYTRTYVVCVRVHTHTQSGTYVDDYRRVHVYTYIRTCVIYNCDMNHVYRFCTHCWVKERMLFKQRLHWYIKYVHLRLPSFSNIVNFFVIHTTDNSSCRLEGEL